MPAYGFVIDQRRCIGCHACTVACKSENDVPLGQFRTWVKYTEKGTYPSVRRHFTVMRCNHCDEAPCVEICPVVALHKRPDAIVDLDRDLCIGCRSCMQACPYDALYLDEDAGVAGKCHYCAHRTEVGLEPACVVVCPEKAIIAGDVDDPESDIAALIRDQETSQRRLEKGTKPRVWYIDALEESLVPGAANERDRYLWSDRADEPAPVVPGYEPTPDILTTLDVAHPPMWGWHIWVYLFTKNVAAGVMMIAPFLGLLGLARVGVATWLPEVTALVFLGITNFLLVQDLGRPERFLKIIFHPNTKSWLVKGAWVLAAFGGLTSASLVARWLGHDAVADTLRWVTLPAAVMASGYSAFLFAQCKARDLWLEKGLFWHLILRAAALGAAFALFLPAVREVVLGPETLLLGLVYVNWLIILLQLTNIGGKDGGEHSKARDHFRNCLAPAVASAIMITAQIVLHQTRIVDSDGAVLAVRSLAVALLVTSFIVYEKSWIEEGQRLRIS